MGVNNNKICFYRQICLRTARGDKQERAQLRGNLVQVMVLQRRLIERNRANTQSFRFCLDL